jgi:hypothetical protein
VEPFVQTESYPAPVALPAAFRAVAARSAAMQARQHGDLRVERPRGTSRPVIRNRGCAPP